MKYRDQWEDAETILARHQQDEAEQFYRMKDPDYSRDEVSASTESASSFADMLNARQDVSDKSYDPNPEATAWLKQSRGY